MKDQFSYYPILVSLLILILMWKRSKTKSSTRNLPPGPRGLPIIGNLHQLIFGLPHYRLRDLANKYGPIMYLQLGETKNIIISSPEAAKEVLKTHDLLFASRPYSLAAEYLAYNARDIAFAQYGEYWRELRKMCTLELFSTKRVQSFRSIREEEVLKLIKSISSSASSGSSVNLTVMTMAISYCVISRAAFGKVTSLEDNFTPLVQQIIIVLGGFSVADLFPSSKFLRLISGMRMKLIKLHKQADAILEEIIKEHRAVRATKSYCRDKPEDLVHILLNMQEDASPEFPLTNEHVKSIILDMFLPGNETSSSVVEWAMIELMRNPAVMKKAQEEVRRVFNGRERIDESSVHELKYLNLVLKETLRIHPPGPLLLPREAREDVEIWGYGIPKKTRVLINAWAINRDSRYWTDPEKFYPERFIDSQLDYKGTNFEYIPFGAGRRMCPGMLYGMTVVELLLANMLYYFDWKLPNGIKPEDMDMGEIFGGGIRRREELDLIPIQRYPLPSN